MKRITMQFVKKTSKKIGKLNIKADSDIHHENYRDKLRSMWPYGDELCQVMREEIGSRAFLKFSGGKDAIATALQLRQVFEEIVPLYLYIVPGLEFIDEAMAYYEKHLFGRKILQAPAPALFERFKHSTFMDPVTAKVCACADLPVPSYEDINELVRVQEGLPPNCYAATGVRYQETAIRAHMIAKNGPVSHSGFQWFPIWDWSKAEVMQSIKDAGLKLSGEYSISDKSLDGLHVGYLLPIKKQFPRDWQKLLEWHPLLEVEVWRYERHGLVPDELRVTR